MNMPETPDSLYGLTLTINAGTGDAATARTVAAMRAVIKHGALDQRVHALATTLVASVANRDRMAQLHALYDWCVKALRFKRDVTGREVLRTPAQMLYEIEQNEREGRDAATAVDCDDVTILVCSVLGAMGFKSAIVVIAQEPGGPFSHVHPAAVWAPRHLIPLDPQERIPLGTWTPAVRRRAWYS